MPDYFSPDSVLVVTFREDPENEVAMWRH